MDPLCGIASGGGSPENVQFKGYGFRIRLIDQNIHSRFAVKLGEVAELLAVVVVLQPDSGTLEGLCPGIDLFSAPMAQRSRS